MDSPQNFQWPVLGELIRRQNLRVIRGEERKRLLERWEEIAEEERALDDRLFLGIIGGTGVGKSTLINAIAGAPISRAGDRRPTTSRIVVYRHESSPLPDGFPREDLAEPEAVHREQGMERTLILDFPDFDSVEADHASVLARFIPRLDVLLVLVDDEKYGDLRLFEVLRALPQAPRNLHFILNKVDRLAERYPERWGEVAGEILSDLTGKLAAHAALRLEPREVIPISARNAYERRSGGRRIDDDSREGEDFAAVLALLDGYRAEKRRRASKEANLEARKHALARQVRELGLDPRAQARAAALRRVIQERRSEIEGILLAAIPPEAIGPRDLKRLYSAALHGAGNRLAGPLRWLGFFLWGKRESVAHSPEELSAMARAHYRPFRDALKAAERELGEEVEELSGPPLKSPLKSIDSGEHRHDFLQDLQKRLSRALRLARLRAHLLPALLIILAIWCALHQVIQDVVQKLADGKTVDWPGVFGEGLAALVAALSPLGILFLLALILLAYAIAAYLDWLRIRRAVDGAVAAFEKNVREDAKSKSAAVFLVLTAPLDEWEMERRELRKALGD